MDLSVIIVNYNVRQFLENALASIQRASEGLSVEIIVVDNASDDGSVEMVRTKFPSVCLIENRQNVGFAKANNMALKQASGDHVLFINPDTVVQEDTFHVMLQFFRDTLDAGLAGCKILNPDGSFQLPCRRSFPTPWVAFTKIFGLSALFPRSKIFGRYNLTYLSPDETYDVEAISGSFMMISREALERVGGFDETFFMYGEDLDLCYRVSQSGLKVYYVHSTKIIHFKGESTRRSELDEIRLFYGAMQQFVEKHFSSSFIAEFFLTVGIVIRAWFAFIAKGSRTFALALTDFVFINIALLAGAYVYRGHFFTFPSYAYPTVYIVPAGIIIMLIYLSGAYTTQRNSLTRVFSSVIGGYIIISAIVFFAKEFAFSRAVVLIAGAISLVVLPGWRVILRYLGSRGNRAGSLFGTRTLIVGTGPSAQEVLRKLRARVEGGYDVMGFIAINRREIGEKIAGLEVIGSIDNVGKVISERRIGEVIFSTDGVSYADILSVIARSNDRSVSYRLVPGSLEAIVGKTRIDELDTLPLVEIEYNLRKPVNRILKRSFDIIGAMLLLLTVFPFVQLQRALTSSKPDGAIVKRILLLPHVFTGKLSFVGRPLSDGNGDIEWGSRQGSAHAHLGPRGLTGLVQINRRDDLNAGEVEKYKLYYAKNHSIGLDLEIMMKSLLLLLKK